MKSSAAVSLTVLVVAHDNAQTLAGTVERVYRALTISVEDFSILVFDDGSTDDTFVVAQSLAQRYPFVEIRQNPKQMGQGYCVTQGSAEIVSDYLVYVPGDNTWPTSSFIELFGNAGRADVVTSYANNLFFAMPKLRRMVSRGYTGLINFIFRNGFNYYNGLTVYPVEYLRRGTIRSRGFGFQAEAILRAVSSGCSFLEIALAVDSRNLLPVRTVTLRNAIDAGLTVARLTFDLSLRRRGIVWETGAGAQSSSRRPNMRPVGPLRIAIFGASSGIGERLARALAEDGHRLFIAARRADRLAAIAQSSERIEAFACDVSQEDEVRRFSETLSASVDAVDVVINCVGTFGEIGPIGTADSGRWWQTVETNLRGAFLVAHYMVPLLRKGAWPRLINFSGGGAFGPVANYSAYACSKSGIIRLTECLAEELAPDNIRVNAIAPGFMATEMHEATLAAGEERAGRLRYRRTQAILDQQGLSMDQVVACMRAMISPSFDDLTGKTISSNFDPWQSLRFLDCIADIGRSDLYTLRRINIVNLPDGRLRTALSQPWADAPSED